MLDRATVLGLCLAAIGTAQTATAPVVFPRGVTNYFTHQPAPARVGQGGLIQITGLNLGPPEGATATETPWPTALGGVQVLVNQRLAPIYSVTPGTIVAQIPYDAPQGMVEIRVRRQGQQTASSPARIQVTNMEPSVRTADDSGFGAPWGATAGKSITLAASGLGQVEPQLQAGSVPAAESTARPRTPLTGYVGGLRASVSAAASTKTPGEFEVNVDLPDGAREGDMINLVAGNVGANSTVYQPGQNVQVDFVRLPENSPDIRAIADAGVNGSFLLASGPRNDEGCFPTLAVDMRKRSIAPVADCLTSANPNIQPVVSPAESDTLAALIGPPAGDQQSGISSKVKIFSAAGDPIAVDLPSAASVLAATATDFRATLPGTPPRLATIDDRTGQVTLQQPAAGAGGGGQGGGGAAPLGNLASLDIDGLKNIYASAVLSQNPVRIAVTIGDDPLKPTRARFVILNQAAEPVVSKNFPDGWLPLLGAPQPPRPNVTVPPPRQSFYLDGQTRLFYTLARAKDDSKHAILAFAFDDSDPKTVDLPEGWFATSCVANIPLFPLELSRRVALMASKVAETEFKQTCLSSGFLLLDLSNQQARAIPMPVQAQALANGASEMNDYVYASAYDATRTNSADTLFVLDGANENPFALSIPSNIAGFTDQAAQIRRLPELNALIAPATRTTVGDQGLAYFDLDLREVRILPVPDGYDRVALPVADNNQASLCCLATRKLVARAFRTGGAGLAVYNLVNNDVVSPPLPAGVTGIGQPQAQGGGQGGGGQQQPPGVPGPNNPGVPGQQPGAAATAAVGGLVAPNFRSNTVSAVAYNGARQVGIVVVRIP